MDKKAELLEERAIKKVINEELGINDEVRKMSHEITKTVIENYNGSGSYVLNFDILGEKYEFNFTFKDYPKLSLTPDSGDALYMGVTYFDYGMVVIDGYTVKGKILEERLREVIQHEVHHIFEIQTSKKSGFLGDAVSRSLYITATKEAKNKQNSTVRRGIGYAIYLSYAFETRAFENGTYAFIMSHTLNFMGDELKVAKSSGFYQRILLIRDTYDFIIKNQDEASDIAKDIYGKSYKWLKKTVTFALKECRRQFSRAVVKAGDDYDWTHGGKTSITV